MSKIYVFSGLGVDRRVFANIDFKNLDVEFIDWIEPLKNEDIKAYAKRISQSIKANNPILIGLSFGGILAIEISKIINTEKVILIASAKTKNELPKVYRCAGKFKLNKLVPILILKQSNFITNWFFGIKAKSENIMLKNILKNTDPVFLKWAINEIVNWKNELIPEKYIHIHGDKDKIIPIKNIKADFIIKNGGHFMTVNKSKEIEKIIQAVCLSESLADNITD